MGIKASTCTAIAGSSRQFAWALILLLMGTLDPCRAEDLQQKFQFDIPGEPIDTALQQFSAQAKIKIKALPSVLGDKPSNPISGTFTLTAALDSLIAGTGLVYDLNKDGTITVYQFVARVPRDQRAIEASQAATQLTGVTVTANKRNENERNIAGSMTALTGKQLKDIGAQTFADYLTTVPGVQYDEQNPNFSIISIRGVTTDNSVGTTQTPVGIFFDEIPMTDPFGVVLIPDIDPFDAQQIEVLRGPQGALFGSGALGGAINYTPNRADPHDLDAHIESTGTLGHNELLGGSVKGMINIPIIADSLAIRGTAYGRYTPGYVDNLGLGKNNSNDSETSGGRMMADWKLGLATTLSLTGFYQRTHSGDSGSVTPGLGDLQKTGGVLELTNGRLNVDDLHLESDLGFAKLVGIAGYQYKHFFYVSDVSPEIGAELEIPALASLVNPSVAPYTGHLHGYTTELRLVSPSGHSFEWLAGVAYADRHELISQNITAEGLVNNSAGALTLAGDLLGPVLGEELGQTIPTNGTLVYATYIAKITEEAVYADASYKFFTHWKLSAGGRGFRNLVPGQYAESGVLIAALEQTPSSTGGETEKDYGFNPRVSLSFQPTEDSLFYALYSRGYSLGGPNLSPPSLTLTIPHTYGPSKLYNFEVGAKTSWLNHRLLVDVTPFHIYWKDVPLRLDDPEGLPYEENAGASHNTGVEVSITAIPIKHVVLVNTVTYLQADLATSFNPGDNEATIPAGTPLPGASRWQGSSIATYKWRTLGLPSHFTLVNRYIGSAACCIQYPSIKQGGYDTMSVRSGLVFQGFSAELFVDNLTDRRGIASTYVDASTDIRDFIIQPRTFGVTFNWDLQ